jgi:hypothetical protein
MASTSPLAPCTPSLTQRLHHPTDRDWAYGRPARAQLLVIGALRAWLWRHLPPRLLPVAAVVEEEHLLEVVHAVLRAVSELTMSG